MTGRLCGGSARVGVPRSRPRRRRLGGGYVDRCPREDIAADVGVPAEEVQTIFDCAVDIPFSNQQAGLDLQKRVPGRAGASLQGQRRAIV